MSETKTARTETITPRYPQINYESFSSQPDPWFDNDPAITEFLHALSIVFPQGEKFFIDSVVNFKDEIQDPTLQKQVKGFVSQELQHSAQHWKYNQHIGNVYGHNIGVVDKIVAWILAVPKAIGTKLGLLAITCALEHFTAIMADLLLNTEKGKAQLNKMPKQHRSLWIWHALEETEHKAVAFDVYKQMGGGYFRRVMIFFLVSHQFIMWLGLFYGYLLYNRGLLFKLETYKSIVRFFFIYPGLAREIFRPWCQYLRRDFHPWQHNNSYLIDQYMSILQTSGVEIENKSS